MTLVGRVVEYLPYLVHALQRAGEQGLGKGRMPMKLVEVRQAQPADSDAWEPIYESGGTLRAHPPDIPAVPASPAAVRIKLETHMRLQREEHLVTPDTFASSDLFQLVAGAVIPMRHFHAVWALETGLPADATGPRR
jgi:hypothetical protein